MGNGASTRAPARLRPVRSTRKVVALCLGRPVRRFHFRDRGRRGRGERQREKQRERWKWFHWLQMIYRRLPACWRKQAGRPHGVLEHQAHNALQLTL